MPQRRVGDVVCRRQQHAVDRLARHDLAQLGDELVREHEEVELHAQVRAEAERLAVPLALDHELVELKALVDVVADEREADGHVEAVGAVVADAQRQVAAGLEQAPASSGPGKRLRSPGMPALYRTQSLYGGCDSTWSNDSGSENSSAPGHGASPRLRASACTMSGRKATSMPGAMANEQLRWASATAAGLMSTPTHLRLSRKLSMASVPRPRKFDSTRSPG
ncbi:hypothetical protein LPJ53_004340, partial [Coemansia erecta]